MRIAKVFKAGRMRFLAGVDLYNAFNSNTVLTQNNNYALWQQPQSIATARFARLGLQFDF